MRVVIYFGIDAVAVHACIFMYGAEADEARKGGWAYLGCKDGNTEILGMGMG